MRRPLWPLLAALAVAGCGEKPPDPTTLPTVPARVLAPQGARTVGKAGEPPVKKAQRDPAKTGN
jgi:hypothetical protein